MQTLSINLSDIQRQFPCSDESEAGLVRLDAGRNLGFTRLVGRKEID